MERYERGRQGVMYGENERRHRRAPHGDSLGALLHMPEEVFICGQEGAGKGW